MYDDNLIKIVSNQAHASSIIRIKQSPFKKSICQYVATSSADDFAINIWYLSNTNLKLIRSYTNHSGDVFGLEWINEDMIASGSQDSTIQIWSIVTGLIQRRIKVEGVGVFCLKLLSNGFFLASGIGNGHINIYNINTGDLKSKLTGHTLNVCDLELINNTTLASSGLDETIRIWNLETNTAKFILTEHSRPVIGLKLIELNILASGSEDYTIKIWNLTNGMLIRTLIGHTGAIYRSLDLLNDDQTLVSGSNDKTIKLWNWKTGECLRTLDTSLTIKSLAVVNQSNFLN